jgi:hypothetical protein
MFNKVTIITPITMIVVIEMTLIIEILNTILLPFSWVNGLVDECIPWLNIMGFERPKGYATPTSLQWKPSFHGTSIMIHKKKHVN